MVLWRLRYRLTLLGGGLPAAARRDGAGAPRRRGGGASVAAGRAARRRTGCYAARRRRRQMRLQRFVQRSWPRTQGSAEPWPRSIPSRPPIRPRPSRSPSPRPSPASRRPSPAPTPIPTRSSPRARPCSDGCSRPRTLSACDITLRPSRRGRGASRLVLFAPVQPRAKHLEPSTPFAGYVARTTADGLPAAPWLRVHARAGRRVVKVAPTSMVVAGSVADWCRWTAVEFSRRGAGRRAGRARARARLAGAGPRRPRRTECLGAPRRPGMSGALRGRHASAGRVCFR